MAMDQNQWDPIFGIGAPPILGFILVVGLGCSLGVRFMGFDPWPICFFATAQGKTGHPRPPLPPQSHSGGRTAGYSRRA